jgi:two-component system, LytTR family, sensor kinase
MGLLDNLPPRPARRRVAALVAAVVVGRAILVAIYNTLGDVQRGVHGTWGIRLIDEVSGGMTALPLFLVVTVGVLRWPVRCARWRRHLVPLLALFLAYSVAHTVSMESLRWLAYPLLGESRGMGVGQMLLAIGHELPNDLFYFALIAGSVEIWRFWWEATDRERREAELRRTLAEAQLTTLRLQLQPHFLFNALNTISSVMYEEPTKADAMLEELSALLRVSLRAHQNDEVSLGEELAIAERYVRLQQARFGDRLQVRLDVPDDCLAARVPVLILQPLLENAVRHGRVERVGRGEVHVTARRDADTLTIEVWDDGDGTSVPDAGGGGLGLRATSERLRLLHGEGATFVAGPVAGGWRVRFSFPLHQAR